MKAVEKPVRLGVKLGVGLGAGVGSETRVGVGLGVVLGEMSESLTHQQELHRRLRATWPTAQMLGVKWFALHSMHGAFKV